MALTVGRLLSCLEEIAPSGLASEWDNVGLQCGHAGQEVERVMLALDVDMAVVDEAMALQAGAIISHHPLIFKPLSSIRTDMPSGVVLAALLNNSISLLTAHTNLDVAVGGVSDVLAALLDLDDVRVLRPIGRQTLLKLVVFVPEQALTKVRQAVCDAGAGHIGAYSHCSFDSPGRGSFMPLPGSSPFIGQVGSLEETDELRLETVLPQEKASAVLEAMRRAHPYEEVAFDLFRLERGGPEYGFGRVGRLTDECSLEEFGRRIDGLLRPEYIKIVGDSRRQVRRVAVCGGSGGSMVRSAAAAADVLVSGDIGYHDLLEAKALGLCIIDAGHAATERPVLPDLAERLQRLCPAEASFFVAQAHASANCFSSGG